MHLRFGMIWAAVAAILVDLGTSAEQSRSARSLGSEVPAKRKLRSDNLINDNKEERAPEKFSFTNLLFDENPENVLSPVLHPQSDPAVSAVAKIHPPPHQQFDAAVSTVPHQHSDASVPTIDEFLAPHDDVKDLLVQMPTFRWIDNVDQYNKKNPLHPINLLDVLEKEGYDEETLIKSVFLPNMDKEVIAQTSGIRNLFEDKEKFEEALIDVQQYAKTRLTNELIKSWLDKELGVDAVIDRLGLSPKASQTASSGQSSKASETAYDFSRYNTLVMYEHAWYLRYRPNSLNVQANNVMEQKGEMDSDAKIWKRKRKWKKRKEREF
ncbi:unnamed protein product [Peronospora effusa]|nr:unnamed protein product [Peronospora effusa]